MNTIWSTYLQKTGTLYESRTLRFHDHFRQKYVRAFALEDVLGSAGRILEIGCGPGALSQSLHRWYPQASILGIDRDSDFIAFARAHSDGIDFAEEDAASLSFADNTFDVTISNTVAEHIEPSKFFGEQYRVLRPGGICLVLSARRGIHIAAPCLTVQSDVEKEVWARVKERCAETDKKYGVCAYPMSEAEYPAAMAAYGFREISTEYITVNLTPDDPCYPPDMACAMIEAQRRTALDAIEHLPHIAAGLVSEAELVEMRRQVNARYDKRIALYDAGEKQWDVSLSLTMILRGVK